jgi:hypothetical protein
VGRGARRQRPYSSGSPCSSLIALTGGPLRGGMVVREEEFPSGCSPNTGVHPLLGSDVGGAMASRGLPRPSTLPTSRTSPLTRSSGRTAAIPSVVSMPAWCRRVRRQRHRGGRPIDALAESRSSPEAGRRRWPTWLPVCVCRAYVAEPSLDSSGRVRTEIDMSPARSLTAWKGGCDWDRGAARR